MHGLAPNPSMDGFGQIRLICPNPSVDGFAIVSGLHGSTSFDNLQFGLSTKLFTGQDAVALVCLFRRL